MCVVGVELRLLLLHTAAELCCVLHDVPHDENKMPRKSLDHQIILQVYCMYLVIKVPMYLFLEKMYFTLVVPISPSCTDSVYVFFL